MSTPDTSNPTPIAAKQVESIGDAVRDGLTRSPKRLPPWLFYDAAGSALYERITELPEYYPTRTERAILATHADTIIATSLADRPDPVHAFELGAGAATKTPLLLAPLLHRAAPARFTPIDVSPTALQLAAENLARALPALPVTPRVDRHVPALAAFAAMDGLKLAIFLGSSLGNYDDAGAIDLLARIRAAISPHGALVLGADRWKSKDILVPAYDDAAGVTAAFNLNLLTRLNQELGADFDVSRFRHVALWNEADSRVEMHLESLVRQTVRIPALGLSCELTVGERIHTESSVKYADAHLDRLLGAAGLVRTRSFTDPDARFAVHVAHVAAGPAS